MRHLVGYGLLMIVISAGSVYSSTHAMPLSPMQDAAVAEPAAQEEGAEAKEDGAGDEKKKKTESVEAKRKPIRVFKTLDGVLESQKTTEVKTDFETWSDLKIKSVAPQGEVTEGAVLIEFDTESIDKAITEAEFALQSARFAQKLAKLDAENAEQTFKLDNAMAELQWRIAQEDNEYYKEVQVPQREIDLAYDEKSSGYFLEYSQDELDQLTQMYTEDELTEESEAIVLKRAQRSVESAQRSRDRSLRRIERSRRYIIPRDDQNEEHDFSQARMKFEKSRVSLPIAKERALIALAKADFELKQKEKKVADLKADLAKMTLRSPANGIMFYGECERGKWKAASSGGRNLDVDKKVNAKVVVMTIVDSGSMMVRSSVPETGLADFSVGLSGKAKFKAAGDGIASVTIDSIERIPLEDGNYDCKISLKGMPGDANLLPGVGCKMSFLVYVNNDSMVVPKSSVFTDDEGFTHYVYVVDEEGETEKIEVVTGKTSGDDVEILEGISVGTMIAKKKP